MLKYSKKALKTINYQGAEIHSFLIDNDANIDWQTVESFGEEWSKFDFFSDEEIKQAGDEYFDIIDQTMISKESVVLDVGCGSGRWSKYLTEKVKYIEAIDPSNAVVSAAKLLDGDNVRITQASVDNIPFDNNSFDFVFSLGVLHHIPDTYGALKKCVEKVKPGGFFMVYLYYSLDNRGFLYKILFKISNLVRWIISSLPSPIKKIISDLIAVFVYLPLVLLSKVLIKLRLRKIASKIPLYNYHDKTFRLIRNDALDRFGTPLEQRFSRIEIIKMMEDAGLTKIIFSKKEPFWHAVGKKK